MAAATIPAFYMVGGKGRDVLLGGREGLYQFDQKLQLSTKTADGVGIIVNAINKGEKGTDLSLKSSYRCVAATGAGVDADLRDSSSRFFFSFRRCTKI